MTNDTLSLHELRYWLCLWHIPGIGPATFFDLLKKFDSLETLFAENTASLNAAGLSERVCALLQAPPWTIVEKTLRWAEKPEHHIIRFCDAEYPTLLKEIASPPPVLFVRGNPRVLSCPQIAMVGSRKASQASCLLAKQFASDLVSAHFAVTSGLAEGIDAASHLGALTAEGVTLAVMGTGIDDVYPRQHHALAERIMGTGALISEFPLQTVAKPGHFPRRNRMISGLSLGTLVVEAQIKSGSLITARYAMEQNREVFAIPGAIQTGRSQGCHHLIREGAKLVETVQDILDDLPITPNRMLADSLIQKQPPIMAGSEEEQILVGLLGETPLPIDILVERSKLAPEVVTRSLLLLELKGIVHAQSTGYTRSY